MDIETKLLELIKDETDSPVDEIKSAETWLNLGFDSLQTVEFIMKIEDEFGIEIADDEAELLKNYTILLDYLKGKVK